MRETFCFHHQFSLFFVPIVILGACFQSPNFACPGSIQGSITAAQ